MTPCWLVGYGLPQSEWPSPTSPKSTAISFWEPAILARLPADQHFTPGDFWRALLGMAWVTGMRKSALLALEWAKVDIEEGIAISRARSNKQKRDQRHKIGPVVGLLKTLYAVHQPGEVRVFAWNYSALSLYRQLATIEEAAGIRLLCRENHEHRGVEQIANSSGNQEVALQGGAKSGALSGDSPPIDPDLALIVNAWPDLPEAVRRQVVGLVMADLKTNCKLPPRSKVLPQMLCP